MNGLDRITKERERQISQEGWKPEYDDAYILGELEQAGHAYLNNDISHWPWNPELYKPKNEVRNLERAGALYMAEGHRLQRLINKLMEQKKLMDVNVINVGKMIDKLS